MASIGGLSNNASNISTIKGFGGLASGLDRDSLIEQMTSRTQTKIQKQKQEKQKVSWQQEAIRNITDKMVEFSQKYLSFTSDTNFLSSTFYARNTIESIGANSKAVSVSGTSPFLQDLAVTSIESLASNAQISSTSAITSSFQGSLVSNDLKEQDITSALSGKSFEIKLGGKDTYSINLLEGNENYGIDLPEDKRLEKTVEALNQALEKVNLKDNSGNLRSKMEFMVSGDKISIANKDNAGNSITLMSGEDVFRSLGMIGQNEELTPNDDKTKIAITSGGTLESKHQISLTKEVNQKEVLKNTSLTFSFNGQRKDIKIDENAQINTMEDYGRELQKAIDKAYGAGKISVDFQLSTSDASKGQLSLKTTDPHATLNLEASSNRILGKDSVIGLSKGDGNRLNLNKKLSEMDELKSVVGKSLKINDKTIEVKEDMTLQELFDKIEKDAGVSIKYSGFLDKVTMTSSEQGSNSKIAFEGEEATKFLQFLKMDKAKDENNNEVSLEQADPSKKYTLAVGTDAKFTIKYPGTGDVTLTRSSNTFNIDGLQFTLKNTFGANATSGNTSTEAVTFSSKVNSDDMVKNIKEMIEAYNEVISNVNTQLSTKQSRTDKYEPLTDQQKSAMTETQITEWEKKAKVGLLFGDSDLRSLSSSLRFVIPSSTRQALEEIGITTSTNYADNGKLTFDEKKFKQAMEANPEKVKNLFIGASSEEKTSFVQNIKNVMDRYARTTGDDKGILVKRAGSKHSPLSMINNTMQSRLDSIQKMITKYETTLKTEQNRYVKQFTQLERVISKMNTQSGWLSQQFG